MGAGGEAERLLGLARYGTSSKPHRNLSVTRRALRNQSPYLAAVLGTQRQLHRRLAPDHPGRLWLEPARRRHRMTDYHVRARGEHVEATRRNVGKEVKKIVFLMGATADLNDGGSRICSQCFRMCGRDTDGFAHASVPSRKYVAYAMSAQHPAFSAKALTAPFQFHSAPPQGSRPLGASELGGVLLSTSACQLA